MSDTTTTDPRKQSGTVFVGDLLATMRGLAVTPDDDAWDDARQAWNLAVDQRPALVVLPTDAADVMAIVQFARRHGLRIAPQTTGHNAGPLPPLDGTILLSTRAMRGVHIDHGHHRARVEAGVKWGEVTEAATAHGLFPLAGSSPDVGVVGYTLGGGLSFLARHHGLAANHVAAVELVTPDGRLVRATADDHAELFWALRGGGGNFGVVTALEFRLFAHEAVQGGMFVWPYERRAEVMEGWAAWTRGAPDAVTTSLRFMHVPRAPEVPPLLAGRSVVVVDGAHVGSRAAGEAAVAGLRALHPEADTWGPTSAAGLATMHMDPLPPTPVASASALLGPLDEAGLHAFAAAMPPAGPLSVGELRHLGGALRHAPPGSGARGSLPGEFLMFGAAVVAAGSEPATARALRDLRRAMDAWDTGAGYAGFVEQPEDPARLYGAGTLDRLRQIRREVDPAGLIVANHPVTGEPPVALEEAS